MSGIFISYRRSDAEGWAGRLSDSLRPHLGRVNIFRDIDDIPPGVDFDTYITDAVSSCGALIALIGPRWLTVTDRTGERRIDDPNDFTRLEITAALKRNVRVIPALVGGAEMPSVDQLPEALKALARRQAYKLDDLHWAEDCRKLADVLKPMIRPATHSRAKILIALAGAIVVALIGYGWKQRRDPTRVQEVAVKDGLFTTEHIANSDTRRSAPQALHDQGRKIEEPPTTTAANAAQAKHDEELASSEPATRDNKPRESPIQLPLGAPRLIFPPNHAVLVAGIVTFSWEAVPGAKLYRLEIAFGIKTPTGPSWVPCACLHGTSEIQTRAASFETGFALELGRPARWRITAIDEQGQTSTPSNWSQFMFAS